MHAFLMYPVVHGAVTGLITAAGIDLHAFLSWKKVQDAVAYDWGVALWRWFQGAVSGAIVAAGYGAVIG